MEADGGKRGPRHQMVVEALREAIVSGRLEPGERLIEERLSTELETRSEERLEGKECKSMWSPFLLKQTY